MKVSTGGYGGTKIREVVRIKTNDPNRPWIGVAITGMVEKFTDIRPERVRLVGPAGTPLEAEVVIVHRKDFPFSVTHIKPKSGQHITYEKVEDYLNGKTVTLIKVKNTRVKKGRYFDVLNLQTDSDIRPTIPIYVTGIIK